MAKKKHTDPKAETAARIQRTEAYAERVRLMFTATVNQILALNRTLPKLEPGVMFSFDGQSLKKQQEVERLLRQLHSVATMAIQQGITLEWGQANAAADTLVKSMFGKEVLSSPQFSAWNNRNGAAMNAFLKRSENGLNLSERVWKAVQQLRDEMEVAITVSVGEGESAQKLSQSVRKYLNDPDLMFRRFRYKAGEEPEYDEDGNEIGKKIIWGRKWKKRIRKPDGTYGWIDYDRDSYKTGAGVYKSSAKNAMRVARTETNIAYRRADHERWQSLDFVLGQRVSMSKDHPKKDICDKLAGDYPKDFVFDGWHPQCFCIVTPITLPPEETAHLTEMFLNGEDWRSELARLRRGREITTYPDNFKAWVTDNAANIQASRERGTEPYFIRNNAQAIDNIINPPKALTPQEIAAQRHAARTPEQEDEIRRRWQERRERMAQSSTTATTTSKKYMTPEERHAARTPEQITDIKARWEQRIERLETQSTLNEVAENAAAFGVTYNNVLRLTQTLKEDEIISKVGGGDKTGGSCSSLAFTYAANRVGFDVRDFRGGDSQRYFSRSGNIMNIATKAGGVVAKDTNDYTKAKQLLGQVVEGKEYYFTCGSHAAIVRKTSSGKFEYLELQSQSDNGWKPLNNTALNHRFGAKRSHTSYKVKYETSDCIIDIELLRKNYGFRRMLGYINTDEAEQKKGVGGTKK